MAHELTKKATTALEGLATVSEWKGKRAYINLSCANKSFRGEATHTLYVDLSTGKLVNEIGKGTCRSEFNAAVREAVSRMSAAGF